MDTDIGHHIFFHIFACSLIFFALTGPSHDVNEPLERVVWISVKVFRSVAVTPGERALTKNLSSDVEHI